MFEYKEKKQKFFLQNPENKENYFGPFVGMFIKNKKLGKYVENKNKISKKLEQYENYKYCIGIGEKKVFILDKNGLNNIINYE